MWSFAMRILCFGCIRIVIERFKEKFSDLEEIKHLTMTELYIYNDQLSDRHKLFYVQKL